MLSQLQLLYNNILMKQIIYQGNTQQQGKRSASQLFPMEHIW